MPLSFLPKIMTEKLTDLTPEYLQKRGIRLLMMDFDNTIVPYHVNEPTEAMAAWLEKLNASPVQLCIVSNTKNERLIGFCQRYRLDYIMKAGKPRPRGLIECMARYGMQPSESAIVGDQIFTDTLAGNFAGVTTILVRAIHNHNIWMKLRHGLELPFIGLAWNRRLNK